MRCLTGFLVLALVAALALAGYNYWQIGQMKGELSSIKAKVHSSPPAPGDRDLLTALALAKRHTSRARELLEKGQTKRARLELDKSLGMLDRASALSQDIAVNAGHGLGAALATVRREVRTTWEELSKQISKGRSKGNEQAGNE